MTRTRIGGVVLAVAAVFTAALLARFLMIEPRTSQLVCSLGDGPAWCPLRQALVPFYTFQGFGILAFAAGVHAFLRRNPASGIAALLLGAAAMVLYNVELGSLATILGLVTLTRREAAAS